MAIITVHLLHFLVKSNKDWFLTSQWFLIRWKFKAFPLTNMEKREKRKCIQWTAKEADSSYNFHKRRSLDGGLRAIRRLFFRTLLFITLESLQWKFELSKGLSGQVISHERHATLTQQSGKKRTRPGGFECLRRGHYMLVYTSVEKRNKSINRAIVPC